MRVKNQFLASVALAAVTLSATSAHAANSDTDVATLRAELAELKAKLAALTEKVDDNSKKAKTASAPEKKWKNSKELKRDDGWSFKPRGRILWDVASVSAPASIVNDGTGFSNEARRVRLGASGSLPGGFGYKVEADFAGGGAELTDAQLTYKAGGLKITAGQHNNFQSLEEISSSNDTSFIERSAFTDAFGFQRKLGLSAQYKTGPLLLQAGVFTDNIDDLGADGNDSVGFDGRVVVAPKFGNAQAHFGGSFHYSDLGDTSTSKRYRQRPLVHSSDIRFINTGNISNVKSETSYGLEAAVIAGPFHAAAETHWLTANRTTGFMDPTFFGGSVEAGYFLTGDKREYKDGVFKGVKVKNPVGKGGLGAFQVNLRYDYLDLNDAGIIGGKQDGYMASLIWTPINYVRFLVNYGKLSYTDAAILAGASSNYDVDVFGGRFQVSF